MDYITKFEDIYSMDDLVSKLDSLINTNNKNNNNNTLNLTNVDKYYIDINCDWYINNEKVSNPIKIDFLYHMLRFRSQKYGYVIKSPFREIAVEVELSPYKVIDVFKGKSSFSVMLSDNQIYDIGLTPNLTVIYEIKTKKEYNVILFNDDKNFAIIDKEELLKLTN